MPRRRFGLWVRDVFNTLIFQSIVSWTRRPFLRIPSEWCIVIFGTLYFMLRRSTRYVPLVVFSCFMSPRKKETLTHYSASLKCILVRLLFRKLIWWMKRCITCLLSHSHSIEKLHEMKLVIIGCMSYSWILDVKVHSHLYPTTSLSTIRVVFLNSWGCGERKPHCRALAEIEVPMKRTTHLFFN